MAIESPISLVLGSQTTFSVEHIKSDISNLCSSKINLRQSSALSFVTIVNGVSSAEVSINTNGVLPGTYTLTLESFESSVGSSMTTLKTDKVTIDVKYSEFPASFASVLKPQTLISG